MSLVVGLATVCSAVAALLMLWLQVRGRRVARRRAPYLAGQLRAGKEGSDREALRLGITGNYQPAFGVMHREGDQEPWLSAQPSLRPARRRKGKSVKLEVPAIVLGMFPVDDALRYTVEFSGHLLELEQDNAASDAKRHRRQIVLGAISLALSIWMRQMLGPSRAPGGRKAKHPRSR
jgi:hypothetical protein